MYTDPILTPEHNTVTSADTTTEQHTPEVSSGMRTTPTVSVNKQATSDWEQAKGTLWAVVRQLFDEEVSKYVSAAQSATTSNDWSTLTQITLPVTMNDNNGKYCCWECGGAKQSSGYAVLIGEPSGSKPLAMSAFRKCNIPNGKQAVVQIYQSCVLVLATQSRGMGVILVYRVSDLGVQDSVYVQSRGKFGNHISTEGESVKHFVMHCQLNKVFNMATHETRQFCNDLNYITADSPIVKAAARKATIYNCEQAIYIRPFFMLKDGYKDWDITSVMIEDTYLKEDRVSSFLTELLAKFSTLVRSMEMHTFPYLGVQILNVLKEPTENTPATLLVKIAIFTKEESHAWNIAVTKKIFDLHRDFFVYRDWDRMYFSATDPDSEYKRSYICKYAGN